MLGHEAEPAAGRDRIGLHVLAPHLDASLRRCDQPEEQAEHRGLPRAIRSDQSDRATRHGDGQAVERGDSPEALREVGEREGGRAVHEGSPQCYQRDGGSSVTRRASSTRAGHPRPRRASRRRRRGLAQGPVARGRPELDRRVVTGVVDDARARRPRQVVVVERRARGQRHVHLEPPVARLLLHVRDVEQRIGLRTDVLPGRDEHLLLELRALERGQRGGEVGEIVGQVVPGLAHVTSPVRCGETSRHCPTPRVEDRPRYGGVVVLDRADGRLT